MVFGSNIPSHEDNSKTLIDEKTALYGGIAVSVIVGLPLAIYSISQLIATAGRLVLFFVAAYVAALVIQFWVSKSYKNGLTIKEIVYAVAWPLDVIRSIRLGMQAMRSNIPGQAPNPHIADDKGEKVLSEKVALIAGIALTIAVFPLMLAGVTTALTVIGSLIWLGVLVYLLGALVQFWVAQSYKDGLTVNEVLLSVLWPVDMIKTIRAGVKAYVNRPAV